MPNDINLNRAPSLSVGEMKSIQISQATTRQTFEDKLNNKLVRAGGAILNGAGVVAGAVMGTLGIQAGVALSSKVSQIGSGMQMSGGSGPVAFSGPSMMQSGDSTQGVGQAAAMASNSLGSETPAALGAMNSAGLGSANGRQQAFGAGAMALPGGDAGGAMGMGVGAAAGAGSSLGGGSVGSAAGGDGQSQLLAATKQMQETQMSFNLQYLQLQSQMQSENRSYTAVSNIMKTKHDTVKNSISNIR